MSITAEDGVTIQKKLSKTELGFFYETYLSPNLNIAGCFWNNTAPQIVHQDEYQKKLYDTIEWPNEKNREFPEYQRMKLLKYAKHNSPVNVEEHTKDWVKYYLNNNKNRCDEFVKDHDKKHVVFSGCSNTFGVGVNLDNVWAKRVYNELNKDNEYSGYFNLAIPGASAIEIVGNLFKYFYHYGNPETVFILFPNLSRDTRYTNEDISDNDNNSHQDNTSAFISLNFSFYLMLVQYCKSNNIRLITSSWFHNSFEDEYVKNLKEMREKSIFNFFPNNYYWVDPKIFYNNIKEYLLKNDEPVIGEDDWHPGVPMHHAWYLEMINRYNDKGFGY